MSFEILFQQRNGNRFIYQSVLYRHPEKWKPATHLDLVQTTVNTTALQSERFITVVLLQWTMMTVLKSNLCINLHAFFLRCGSLWVRNNDRSINQYFFKWLVVWGPTIVPDSTKLLTLLSNHLQVSKFVRAWVNRYCIRHAWDTRYLKFEELQLLGHIFFYIAIAIRVDVVNESEPGWFIL